MLLQMLVNQPQMIGPVLKGTPPWVWSLLAALAALGLTQLRSRSVSLGRLAALPLAMTALSLWGALSALRSSPLFGYVMLAWVTAAVLGIAAIAALPAPRGARYDIATRRFSLPGSWVPLLLILSIFLTRYVVGVELALQPGLARDGEYMLSVGALYGMFSGIFIGRTVGLWRLTLRPASRTGHIACNA